MTKAVGLTVVNRLTLCAVLCLVACGGTSPPPPVQNAAPAEPVTAPPPAPKRAVEVAMEKMDEFATRMCGCPDKACADAVQNDMTQWSSDLAKDDSMRELDAKPSEEDLKRMTEIGTKYGECMTKAMAATP